jgi:3-carboxy-cis,cis-muconate cycloisomerase
MVAPPEQEAPPMTVNPADSEILGTLFGTDEMRAVFGDHGWVQAMLDVEAALARAQARLGIVPNEAADAITRAAKAENLSFAEMAAQTRNVGYAVLPLVRALGKAVGGEAAGYIHWGATTQDILDTALVLQMRDGLAIVERDLARVARGLAGKARTHRNDVMAGRTHLQHALPVTFGYKCAVWLDPLLEHLERLRELRSRVLAVQFAGAVGTLASLGDKGRAVTTGLAEELGLAAPVAPWHATRERVAETACFLGVVCGSLAKLATDMILLMQTEVAEANEPFKHGRGGSSTMPQKRNPIASEYVAAAARGVHALVPLVLGAMAGDHERSTGPWQSEQLAMPQIFVLTAGALAHAAGLAEGMTVDPVRMRQNLDSTGGLILSEAVMMALAPKIGRTEAHDVVEHACARVIGGGGSLAEALAGDAKIAAHLDRAAIDRMLDPAGYLGEATGVVDRVLARASAVLS